MQSIGPYRVVRKLGEGGMGAVYLAEDDALRRPVAVKVISGDVARDPQRRARFEREARAAAVLTHPNICAVHAVGETQNGEPYIAMEYIDGSSLRARIARERGSMSIRAAVEIAIEVADALAAAHSRGIVHRDVKPDNVMLTGGDRVKVVDFGLAKIGVQREGDDVGEDSSTLWVTTAGVVVGTTQYMSPEQASGVADLDGRTDIFSLGVVLYEMLTGAQPFTGSNVSDLLHKLCVEDPPPVSSLNPAVPPELAAIVAKCMVKQRDRRYQSASDLAADLRRVRDLLSVPSATRREPAALVRHWPLFAGVAAIVLFIAAGAVMWTRSRDSSGSQLRRTAPIQSLAVLPFHDDSAGRADDYLANGLTDELTTRLSSIAKLRVVPRASAMTYRDSKRSLPDIGRELRADALVTGTVSQVDGGVKVLLRLIDGQSGSEIWSRSYVRPAGDVASLQSDLAGDVAGQIGGSVTPVQSERVRKIPTKNPAAYEAYLHAIYKLQTSLDREKDADDAIRYAEQAIAADPDFANAYVALAHGCVAKLFQWKGEAREYDEKAFVAVGKALAIDPGIAEAYVVRGQLRYNALHKFDLSGAIADYFKAVQVDPNSAVAHHALAADLTHAGFHDLAIEHFRIALRLEPDNDGSKIRLPRALWQSNRFEEALNEYRRFGIRRFEYAVTLGYLGKMDEAWSVLRTPGPRAATTAGHDADNEAARAFLFALEHKRREADEAMNASFASGGTRAHFHHAAVILAAACAELGETDAAVRWLRLAADTGMPNYPMFRDNPSLAKLHGSAAYEQFMSELKPAWDQLASQVTASR